MRSASNVSQNSSLVQEKIRNSFVSSSGKAPLSPEYVRGEKPNYNTVGIPTTPDGVATLTVEGFSGLNRSYMRDLENFNEDYAPVVREYVQFNPNNNVQRNESLTIGNPDIIAELKMRNQQRRKNKLDDETNDSFGIL